MTNTRHIASDEARSARLRSFRAQAVAIAMLCGPASAFAADLPVYDATQVAYGSYTIVKRIWVEDWRSAFYVPTREDLASARQAVIDRAARAGAEAVVNLACVNGRGSFNAGGFYCYADAVRAKQPSTPERLPK